MSRFGVYGSGPVRMKINGSRLVTWSEENVVKSFENGIDKSENSVDILGKFIIYEYYLSVDRRGFSFVDF